MKKSGKDNRMLPLQEERSRRTNTLEERETLTREEEKKKKEATLSRSPTTMEKTILLRVPKKERVLTSVSRKENTQYCAAWYLDVPLFFLGGIKKASLIDILQIVSNKVYFY